MTLGNQWFLRRDQVTCFSEQFLDCPRCITPRIPCWRYHTGFLHHKFPASGICVLVAQAAPARTCKHILLNVVGEEGAASQLESQLEIQNTSPSAVEGRTGCWKWIDQCQKLNERMENTDQLFLHLYLERRGNKMLATRSGSFFGVNDKAFWYAGNNCFPSRVFGHLKGNKATPNL